MTKTEKPGQAASSSSQESLNFHSYYYLMMVTVGIGGSGGLLRNGAMGNSCMKGIESACFMGDTQDGQEYVVEQKISHFPCKS